MILEIIVLILNEFIQNICENIFLVFENFVLELYIQELIANDVFLEKKVLFYDEMVFTWVDMCNLLTLIVGVIYVKIGEIILRFL